MSGFFFKKTNQLPQRRDIARARQRDAEKETGSTERYSFQRSHTLTGSMSSGVKTPIEASAQLRSPRVKSHELTRARRHIFGLLCACGVIVLGLFFIIYEFSASVTVTINGNSSIADKADYAAKIQSYFASNPLERLRFMTNDDNLTVALQQKNPEISRATIDGRVGFGVSHVSIETRQPAAEWTINGQKLYVDHDGIAFSRNYFDDPSVTIVDQSGIRVTGSQMLVSNAFLSFVGQVVGAADKLENVKVTKITLPPNTTRQITVSVAGVSYQTKMTTDRGAGEQVEDMARAIRWFKKHQRSPRYVDVRVAGQAFYK